MAVLENLVASHSKSKVSYFYDHQVGNFYYGLSHPMKPHRLALTTDLVLRYNLHQHLDFYQPRQATETEMKEFHTPDYIDFLKRVSPNQVDELSNALEKFNLSGDSPLFDGLFDFCKLYTGASIEASRKLVAGDIDIAINWSGGLHHAKKSSASGFCYVNDIVLAILQLLRVYPRVLYIDIDVHHGDGVQEAFYHTDRVMTVSFHQYNGRHFFPGTGAAQEIGNGLGQHFSLNVPLKEGIDGDTYLTVFKSVIESTMERYRPSAVVLQCGADSLACDQLGGFNLSFEAHGECVKFVKAFKVPLLLLGGGGYTVRNVSRCWAYETSIAAEVKLPNELPEDSPYLQFFGPDYTLCPKLPGRADNNSYKTVAEKARVQALEQLRHLVGAPSVQLQEIPPDIQGFIDTFQNQNADEMADIYPDLEGKLRRRPKIGLLPRHRPGDDGYPSSSDDEEEIREMIQLMEREKERERELMIQERDKLEPRKKTGKVKARRKSSISTNKSSRLAANTDEELSLSDRSGAEVRTKVTRTNRKPRGAHR